MHRAYIAADCSEQRDEVTDPSKGCFPPANWSRSMSAQGRQRYDCSVRCQAARSQKLSDGEVCFQAQQLRGKRVPNHRCL